MRREWNVAVSMGVALISVGSPLLLAHSPERPSMCKAAELSLTTDGADGAFNGMSQSGTYLLLKNTSATACRISPMPRLIFFDAKHNVLAITREVPGTQHMHPGPVVLPITLAAGEVIRSTLRWTSGPVFGDGGVCLQLATVDLQVEQGVATAQLLGTVCGPARDKVKATMTRFAN